jgi:hypothetical protein
VSCAPTGVHESEHGRYQNCSTSHPRRMQLTEYDFIMVRDMLNGAKRRLRLSRTSVLILT